MDAYINPIRHSITLEIRGKHILSDKYPNGIIVKHESDSKLNVEKIEFWHDNSKIEIHSDINFLYSLYNSLIEL